MHYKFEWAVRDDYSSVDMGQFEGREGRHTKGFYYVLLPDGRRQIVDYYVDGDSGYVADVRYVGSASKYVNNNDYKEQLIVEEILPVYETQDPIYKEEIVLPVYKEENHQQTFLRNRNIETSLQRGSQTYPQGGNEAFLQRRDPSWRLQG